MKVLTQKTVLELNGTHEDTFSISRLCAEIQPRNQHFHKFHEIYYSVSGGKTLQIDEKKYRMEPGNLFFISPHQRHQITQLYTQVPYERILFYISPAYLSLLSTQETDLSGIFAGKQNRVSLSSRDQKRFLYYVNRIVSAEGFGRDLAQKCALTELLIFLNRLFSEEHKGEFSGDIPGKNGRGIGNGTEEEVPEKFTLHDDITDKSGIYSPKIVEIIEYIHRNIETPLTIRSLSAHFYLSQAYLCRLFKSATGLTINQYVTGRRIAMAKSMLEDGLSVNDVYPLCGFNDYSNFFKAFRKNVGISPKKYSQNSLQS